MIYTLLVLILVSVALLISVRHPMTIYLRRLAFPALCVIFTVCLVLFSDTAAKAALKGLNLWTAVVVPSLFPFFAASELLSSSGFTYMAGTLLEPVMRPLFNLPGCSSLALALGVTFRPPFHNRRRRHRHARIAGHRLFPVHLPPSGVPHCRVGFQVLQAIRKNAFRTRKHTCSKVRR